MYMIDKRQYANYQLSMMVFSYTKRGSVISAMPSVRYGY